MDQMFLGPPIWAIFGEGSTEQDCPSHFLKQAHLLCRLGVGRRSSCKAKVWKHLYLRA